MLDGLLWKPGTDVPWRDLGRILADVVVTNHTAARLEWIISVGSTVARAQQHASRSAKKGVALLLWRLLSSTVKGWVVPAVA